MNITKTFKLSMVALVAVACASVAQAQTTVRITGSTAYRGNTHNAIKNVFDAGVQYGFVGSSFTGASQAYFSGNIGGNPVIIKTSWSGSEGGIQTVAGSVAIGFLPNSTTISVSPGTSGATACTSGGGCDVSVPDVAMSDSFQSSSAFFGLYRGVTYPTLTESPNSPVGIVPFKWVANKLAPAGLTNIDNQLARALFGAGTLPLALFTGNNADQGSTVIATGRDPDSGTRLTALAEGGLGPQASVKQWQPQTSGGALITTAGGAVAKFAPWPASTINGIPVALFNGGYSSGGQLGNAMGNTTPAGFTLVTYLGVSDADNNAIPNGGVELKFNGVLLGNVGGNYNNATALTEGDYTFWGYEHLYYRAATAGTAVGTVADTIANQLKNTDAQVFLSSMKVLRNTDGSVVLPGYSAVPPPQ